MSKTTEPILGILKHRKRFVAVGCGHGIHLDQSAWRQFLKFCAAFKPQVRIHLGDAFDTTAFRAGALDGAQAGKDQAASICDDLGSGLVALQQYEPTVFFAGNHEDRLVGMASHPKAIIAYAAGQVQKDIDEVCRRMHCETVPYDIERGWRRLGDTLFGHGYMFNENAPRDHAESFGKCVIAHLHKVAMVSGRALNAPSCYVVGCMAEIPAMAYARRRRSSLSWANGFAYGEYTEDSCDIRLRTLDVGSWKAPGLLTT